MMSNQSMLPPAAATQHFPVPYLYPAVGSNILFLDTPLSSISSQAKTALESNSCSSTCGLGPVLAKGEALTHPPNSHPRAAKILGVATWQNVTPHAPNCVKPK